MPPSRGSSHRAARGQLWLSGLDRFQRLESRLSISIAQRPWLKLSHGLPDSKVLAPPPWLKLSHGVSGRVLYPSILTIFTSVSTSPKSPGLVTIWRPGIGPP